MRIALLTGWTAIALCLAAGGVMAQDADRAGAAADSTRFVRNTPVYSSRGQRDPFDSLAPVDDEEGRSIKELFNYEEGSLKGIVRTGEGPYAMVVDGDGMSYVLFQNTRVNGGYVSRITDDAVYLNIVKYGRGMTIIFRTQEARNKVVQLNGQAESVRKPGITIDYRKSGPAGGGVTVSDVVTPPGEIRTVDEVWFGVARNAAPGETAEQPMQRNRFALYDPADGKAVRIPYELNWTDPQGDIAEYMLIIDDDPDYSSPAVTVSGITESNYLLTDELRLPSGMKLYWQVVATGPGGDMMTSFRNDMSFTIQSEQEVQR